MTTKTSKLHYEAVLQKLLASSDLPALADLVGGVGTNMPGTPSEMRDEGEARVQTAPRKPTRAPNLAKAYRSYWILAESEPLDVFQAAYQEIAKLEAQTAPAVAWRTLREAASAYHAESGTCPFCREAGALHLPAEQITLELRRG